MPSVTIREIAVILCDRVKREAGTNKATLDGIFDRVFLPAFPGGMNMALFIRVVAEDAGSELPLTFNLVRPNGMIERFPPVRLVLTDGRAEGQVNIQGLPIMEPGEHRFELSHGSTRVGLTSFIVEEVRRANPAAN